jgi:diacylglycerol kinase
MIRFRRLLKSFKYSFTGLGSLIKKEQNFRIHIIASMVVIILGFYFQITIWEWTLVILMIAMVLILEMLNTVFERFVDMLKPRIHHYVKEIKDVMSAIVFTAALTSVIIGLIIFVPHIIEKM